MNMRLSVIMSLDRAITLFGRDIDEEYFYLANAKRNIANLENNILDMQKNHDASSYLTKKIDSVHRQIIKYYADADKYERSISVKQDDIQVLQRISELLRNQRNMKSFQNVIQSAMNGQCKRGTDTGKIVESVTRATKMLSAQIKVIERMQTAHYITNVTTQNSDDTDFTNDCALIINVYRQDIENLNEIIDSVYISFKKHAYANAAQNTH